MLSYYYTVLTIQPQVMRGHRSSTDSIADYCDGTVYRSHTLFSEVPEALQIFLYYDAEVCNLLGSRAKKHKLGMYYNYSCAITQLPFEHAALFYYTLGNISPLHRSTLKCIQLLTVTKSTPLQAYGPDCLLENFMKDIKKLAIIIRTIRMRVFFSTSMELSIDSTVLYLLLWGRAFPGSVAKKLLAQTTKKLLAQTITTVYTRVQTGGWGKGPQKIGSDSVPNIANEFVQETFLNQIFGRPAPSFSSLKDNYYYTISAPSRTLPYGHAIHQPLKLSTPL